MADHKDRPALRGHTSTIPVPAHVFGLLIGKGGSFFRQLRSREGITSLWLDQAEGTLTVRGSAVAVNKLIAFVRHVIDAADRRPLAEAADPASPCEVVEEPAGHASAPAPQASPAAATAVTVRTLTVPSQRGACKPPTAAADAPLTCAAPISAGVGRPPGAAASVASEPSSSRAVSGPRRRDRPDRTAQDISVPAAAVSAVIGRGGATFKMLRGRDGISTMWLAPETHQLTVRGTPAAVAGVLREVKAIIAWASGSSDLFAAPGERLPPEEHTEDCIALPDAAAVDVIAGADGRGTVISRLRRTPGVTSVALERGGGASDAGALLRVVGEPDAVADVIYDVQRELAELRRWQQKQAAARARSAAAGSAGSRASVDAGGEEEALVAGMSSLAVAAGSAAGVGDDTT